MKVCAGSRILLFLTIPAFLGSGTTAQTAPQKQKTAPHKNEDALSARLLAQGEEALEQKNYPAAVKLYSEYLAKKPSDATAHFQLGYAYTALQEHGLAEQEFRKAAELNPKMGEAWQDLGLTLLHKDPASAADAFGHAAELLTGQSNPRFMQGVALERSGRLAQAIEAYWVALRVDTKDFQAHLALAQALVKADRTVEAEPEFRAVLELEPKSDLARLGLAESLAAQKKNDAAAAAYSAYLEVRPHDVEARVARAFLLVDSGQEDDALEELNRAAQQAPERVGALKLRSLIAFHKKDYDGAAEALTKAASLAPDDPEIHARLGHVALLKKNYGAAIRELTQSLQMDQTSPAQRETLRDLAAAEYLDGNCPRALQALGALAKQETLKPGAWFIRAACFDKMGQKAEALETYEKFLQLNAGEPNDEYFQAAARARTLRRELNGKQ